MSEIKNNLPELTAAERAAMESIDMTPIVGTVEHRLEVASRVAINFMRKSRNAQKEVERLHQLISDLERIVAYVDRQCDYLSLIPATGRDGQWEASLVDGQSGFGATAAEALHNLAVMLPPPTPESGQ